ncbi:MAG: 50S ribosomal protein L3 [Patescibacteria group bacterium]
MKNIGKFILGRKQSMTQIFNKDGIVVPATIVEISPIEVTAIKTKEIDGYTAIQINSKKGKIKVKKEYRTDDNSKKIGDSIDMSIFKEGDEIEVSAISKGKGFQGVVKRHGFGGGPRSHGQKHSEREPGSIGGGLRNKVPKKMRMAGRMGGDRITVKNLKIVHIDTALNTMYISGAIPGRRGTLIEIKG